MEKQQESKVDEETESLEGEIYTREKAINHPLFEKAKEFWKSPWGIEAIKRAREKDGNKLSEGSSEGIQNNQ